MASLWGLLSCCSPFYRWKLQTSGVRTYYKVAVIKMPGSVQGWRRRAQKQGLPHGHVRNAEQWGRERVFHK